VIPVLGIAAFIPAFFSALGIGGSVLKFVSLLNYPSSGERPGHRHLVPDRPRVLGYLYARHPERLPEMTRVFAPDAPALTPAAKELRPPGRPPVA
jgi:hypothetical protein